MMNIKNKVELNKNDYNNIYYDKRKLPLFKTPIILKKLNDESKNNINLINYKKDLNLKIISFKEIVKIFLKGIKLYNENLNKYLKYFSLFLKEIRYYRTLHFLVLNNFIKFNLISDLNIDTTG